MGRELQKRKRRSSRPTIRQPTSNRSNKRLLNPMGNDLVARNWNKNETTSQNYRRLGLVSRLNAPTGGVEPELDLDQSTKKRKSTKPRDPFAIQPASSMEGVVSEARVERDENGKIIKVIHAAGKFKKPNPLNDPLNGLDTDSENEVADDGETWGGIDAGEDETTEIVKQLEAEANLPRVKKIRGLSHREKEWLESLIERHGGDTRAMARDRKLNPMQQTEADIARRIRKLSGEA